MNKVYHSLFFTFSVCFFSTIIVITFFVFFYLYQQVSIMSNLIAVSQNGPYKVYVYFDKSIPSNDVESISNCLSNTPSDIKATMYLLPPKLFNRNAFSLGVIGKVDDMCDKEKLSKWEHILWKNDGVDFGEGGYFFRKESFPKLK